jgi:hypothetical protein
MRPLFAIHAGEFIVGEHIERTFRRLNAWVPTKDTGIDLLVTNANNSRAVSLQVKFSRDYLTAHMSPEMQKPMRVCGWFTFERSKMLKSAADFWVLALLGSKDQTRDYVIIRPRELVTRLDRIHGKGSRQQVYIWVTETRRSWLARGLPKIEELQIAYGRYVKSNQRYFFMPQQLENACELAAINSTGPWPGSFRPSRSLKLAEGKAWMPATRPGMTGLSLRAQRSNPARNASGPWIAMSVTARAFCRPCALDRQRQARSRGRSEYSVETAAWSEQAMCARLEGRGSDRAAPAA